MGPNTPTRDELFFDLLKLVKDAYVIIDTNPILGTMQINALTASDSIIPVQAEPFAVDKVGYEKMDADIANVFFNLI